MNSCVKGKKKVIRVQMLFWCGAKCTLVRWERSGCIDPTFEFDVTFSSRLSSFRVTCMQDYLMESGKQSTRTTLLCSEPAGRILRTFLAERELETLRFDTSYDFFVRVWKLLFGIRLSKTLRLVKILTILWSFFVFTCLTYMNTNEWR